jgi:dipeptidyl aminopeptidase/acylaminoacyl peptidase
MANWIAGHTDRFRAIVTHASLWALDQFSGTTDSTWYWRSIFSPQAMIENSPHRHVDAIATPMLVVHGDRDYRVPIGEGLRLWSELTERFTAADGTTPHRFLYFPDENHWILKPQHAVVWYETVLGFLDGHVVGEDRPLPDSLG